MFSRTKQDRALQPEILPALDSTNPLLTTLSRFNIKPEFEIWPRLTPLKPDQQMVTSIAVLFDLVVDDAESQIVAAVLTPRGLEVYEEVTKLKKLDLDIGTGLWEFFLLIMMERGEIPLDLDMNINLSRIIHHVASIPTFQELHTS